MMYLEERKQMCEVVRIMFDRNMTNAAGGNVSRKINDEHYIMTPTLMSQQKFCRLEPKDILVIDKDYNIIEGEGALTREVNMHMGVYKVHPNAKVVMHSHPNQTMVYAALSLDMPLLCENVMKLGSIPCLDFAPACSQQLADTVTKHIVEKGDFDNPQAMILNKHGILVVDFELKAAYDLLERIESNAYVSIMSKLFTNEGHEIQDYDYNLEE